MNTIAAHLHHDSTLSLSVDGEFHNIELERIFGQRHYDWRQQGESVERLLDLNILRHRNFQTGIVVGAPDISAETLFSRLGVSRILRVDHHQAHAGAAFYESHFDKSLVVSYDGGGNDGTFRAFIGRRDAGLTPINKVPQINLGIPYRALAHPIAEIKKPDDGRELSNAGKLMGLAAFGRIRPDWTTSLRTYYQDCSVGGTTPPSMYRWVVGHLGQLGSRIGLSLSRNSLEGRDGHDLARTAQHVFEDLFLERVLPLIEQYQLPICITGGCALNVLTNQRLSDTTDLPIFVPPNPNDCGLAQGALLLDQRPQEAVEVTYSGIPIADQATLVDVARRRQAVPVRTSEIAKLLSKGHVVAVMRGCSEHGPRALGNRSILCHPGIPHMKERLNERVKFRESFRPYAPVVRRNDLNRFFSNARQDSSFMSFNPTVRSEWRGPFAAALHVDSTARVQTVTREQNEWLFDLLTEFDRLTGVGALLNTSFNTKGRPMVNTVAEAMELFLTTEIDSLVIDSWLFNKTLATHPGPDA